MISLDFLVGTLLVIAAAPFLTFSWQVLKRLPLLIGVVILAKAMGTLTDTVLSAVAFLVVLAFVIALALTGSMLLAQGLILWVS